VWDKRWRETHEAPEGLTWGVKVDGQQVLDAFLFLGCSIGPASVVVEVGPGYGRIFEAFHKRFQFKRWYMVEINPKYCEILSSKSVDDRVKVLCQDVRKLDLPEKFDLGISTLVIEHLYPDFLEGLAQLRKFIKRRGSFVFDLPPPSEDRRMHEYYESRVLKGSIVNFYSEEWLRRFVELSGFSIDACTTVDYKEAKIVRNLYRLKPNREIANWQDRRLASLEHSLEVLEKDLAVIKLKLDVPC